LDRLDSAEVVQRHEPVADWLSCAAAKVEAAGYEDRAGKGYDLK
jgi:PPE-repeat protein